MEEARSAGPAVVSAGPEGGPAVVVLDPAGVAVHGELPATWRPLTEHLHVTWCRLPAAEEPWQEAERVLDECARRGTAVHLVASAAAGAGVGELATKYDGAVRSVQTFAAPLPLGHPDVVAEVVRELLAGDVGGEGQDDGSPGSLLGGAAPELRRSLEEVLERLRAG